MSISSEITRAAPEDIPELCLLLDQLFTQEAEFEPDHLAQVRGLEIIINNQDVGDILVARHSGKVVAMVNVLYTVSTALGGRVGILEDMVVLASYRESGVGSKLLCYAIEFARNNGCKRISLLTDSDNDGAQRFYQRHGFSRSSMVLFRMLLDTD
jgi:GNAT superfamily N-acetyltransferase